MNIIRPEEGTQVYDMDGAVGKKLLSKAEVEVVRIELAPGSSLPVHRTPVDVFFFIIEGSGEIEVGGERKTVEAGSVVESPKDIPHGLHNRSDSPFRVLVVKTPRP
ncbi:MAG: cupin domain-containing protein [Spirochaetota bacterium]|nr:cupin domain-containing protein [Spirochaetota bacterium]